MQKMQVMTVVGTRPEIIRLSRVIAKLDQYTQHTLVHTGQNYDYELNEIFFQDLEIRKPDHFLNAAGKDAVETIGRVLIETNELISRINPDAILVLGDTNSCMAALVGKRYKIPVFHMEAGNRCFDQRVPEEINRRMVDHIADINLTYSSIARDYLLNEGLPADQIIKTGSPMFEVLNYYKSGINSSNVLTRLNLKERNYFLISAHREENVDSDVNFSNFKDILNSVAKHYDMPVIVSTHPRTQKKIDSMQAVFNKNVRLLKPLGFKDYNKLQIMAKTVLSDSGTINEEASILNFPALNIREAFERPEGMEEAAVMLVGMNLKRVMQGLAILEEQPRGNERLIREVSDYKMPNVAEKVVRIIHSYTDYVNRAVWQKHSEEPK